MSDEDDLPENIARHIFYFTIDPRDWDHNQQGTVNRFKKMVGHSVVVPVMFIDDAGEPTLVISKVGDQPALDTHSLTSPEQPEPISDTYAAVVANNITGEFTFTRSGILDGVTFVNSGSSAHATDTIGVVQLRGGVPVATLISSIGAINGDWPVAVPEGSDVVRNQSSLVVLKDDKIAVLFAGNMVTTEDVISMYGTFRPFPTV